MVATAALTGVEVIAWRIRRPRELVLGGNLPMELLLTGGNVPSSYSQDFGWGIGVRPNSR